MPAEITAALSNDIKMITFKNFFEAHDIDLVFQTRESKIKCQSD